MVILKMKNFSILLLVALIGLSGHAQAAQLCLSVDDPVNDQSGSIDLEHMFLVFDNDSFKLMGSILYK